MLSSLKGSKLHRPPSVVRHSLHGRANLQVGSDMLGVLGTRTENRVTVVAVVRREVRVVGRFQRISLRAPPVASRCDLANVAAAVASGPSCPRRRAAIRGGQPDFGGAQVLGCSTDTLLELIEQINDVPKYSASGSLNPLEVTQEEVE